MTTSPHNPALQDPALTADCARCFGLCCAALPFARSADFPEDKAAGQPCRNLQTDFRCGIHSRLRDDGWKGCTVFECFGAGQQVSQVTFDGVSWREAPATGTQMYAVFAVMRQLHEMLWYLREVDELGDDGVATTAVRTELLAHVNSSPERLEAFDVAALRGRVGAVLREASSRHRRSLRAHANTRKSLLRKVAAGADLAGTDLSGRDLRGVDLRGASLIAADLRTSDLRHADLLGADLRDARLSGADLRGALFLTQPQVNAARGDRRTRLSARLRRPSHWD